MIVPTVRKEEKCAGYDLFILSHSTVSCPPCRTLLWTRRWWDTVPTDYISCSRTNGQESGGERRERMDVSSLVPSCSGYFLSMAAGTVPLRAKLSQSSASTVPITQSPQPWEWP